jgi:Ca2+-binding RTX toxin-like protein
VEAARPQVRTLVAAIVLALIASIALASRADAAPGDVYLGDTNARSIFKVAPGGGAPQLLAAIPDSIETVPNGLAMDRSGILYWVGFDNTIRTVDRSNGALGIFATLPSGAELSDVAVGPDQNLYLTDDTGNGAVLRVEHVTKAVTPVAPSIAPGSDAAELAVARDGTIYVSDYEQTIYRVTSAGAVTPLASSPILSGADGLALTPDDRTLYVGSFGSPDGDCCAPPNSVVKVDVATGAVTRLAEVSDSVAVSLRTDGSILSSNTEDDLLEVVPAVGSPVTPFSSAGSPLDYPHDTVIEPETCRGLFPNVVGTIGSDNLVGSAFGDVISTLGGKDTVKAGGGDDIVCGGTGKDKLLGQGGRDKLLGQGGKDILNGGKKKDLLKGGGGKDRCRGGKGDKLRSC